MRTKPGFSLPPICWETRLSTNHFFAKDYFTNTRVFLIPSTSNNGSNFKFNGFTSDAPIILNPTLVRSNNNLSEFYCTSLWEGKNFDPLVKCCLVTHVV